MNFKRVIKRICLIITIVIFVPILASIIVLPFYKQEIKITVIQHIKLEYGLDVLVGNVGISVIDDWPNATVVFENVEVINSTGKSDQLPIIEAGSIRFSVGLLKLLKKKVQLTRVSLSDAKINVIIDENGDSNCELKSGSEKKNNSKLVLDLKRVRIKNVIFNFENRQLHKHIGLRLMDNTINIKKNFINYSANINGGVFIEELLFKTQKGPFLKNTRANLDLNLLYYPDLKTMMVGNNSNVKIDNQTYLISACLDGRQQKLALRIIGEGLNFEKSLRLLNTTIRSRLKEIAVTKELDVNALIVTSLNKKEDPELFIKIRGRDNFVFIGDSKVPFSNVNFDIRIECIAEKNMQPEMSNAKIYVTGLNGNIYSVPFSADVLIKNFKQPRLWLSCKLKGDGQQINNSVPIDIRLIGILEVDMKYNGALRYVNKKDFLGDSTNLEATMVFKNIVYMSEGSFPLKLNGKANINNDTLTLRALKINTNGGDFLVDGIALDFADYICGVSTGFRANVKASSNLFDLSPFLLAKQNTTKKVSRPSMKRKASVIKRTDFEFKVQLHVKNTIIRKVRGTDLNADLHYYNNDLLIKDLSFNLEKGNLKLKGKLEKFKNMQAEVNIKNADVNLLFDQFENFGQKAIKAENLQGTIDVDANIALKLTPRYEFEKNSAKGTISLKLLNGHLLDYEPLQNVSNFIFRKRNFKDIIFSEIEETFVLEGDKIRLSKMEIASNVINLYVDGIYSFKGVSNLNVRIPWSNFKSRKKDFIPVNIGEAGARSKAIKLNINGYPDQMKISLGAKEEN